MNNKIKLSQCMIVKNEEKNIEQALRWAKNITFEQIVVDTGSTDRTVEIAKKMGAKVYHFEWINDFSAAKNFAIEQATGDWITTLDADEYMEKQDSRNLLTVLELISKDKGLAKKCKAISSKIINTNDDGSFGISFYTVRVFKNDPSIRFKGRIHEELTLETSSIIKVNDFNIIHTGYTTEAK
ncbi:MAG: glycosyltransferase family 2 protein, partial [Oscillospiraceae bacterium]|nr:glycosyltransferase family 2 protein [Oscillospiraceae bacterium]